MRFTYAETATAELPQPPARPRRTLLHHLLTTVLALLSAAAIYELVSFGIDYARALNG